MDKSVLIFGCGDLGKLAKAVFQVYGINIIAYMSNRMPESGMFEERPVYCPNEAVLEYPEAEVAVCIFNDEVEKQIKEQLYKIGFRKFIDKEWIITSYFSKALRPMGLSLQDDKISAYFTLYITDYCSLKCKYCGTFSPYIKDAHHYPAEECIKPVKRMAQVVDRITCLTIQGGETFLHPELPEICEELASLDAVKKINIISNGTIIPPKRFFDKAKKYRDKITIRISDYGELNSNYDSLKNICSKEGLSITKTLVDEYWEKPLLPVKQNRTQIDNRNVYMTCESMAFCPFMVGGRLYKCETAGIRERMGWIPKNPEDSLDFLDDTVTNDELRAKIIKYITSAQAIEACDYCYNHHVRIEKAQQITEKDWSIENIRDNI